MREETATLEGGLLKKDRLGFWLLENPTF